MKKLMIISTMVLAFLTLTKNANGQCFDYNWTNNSDCNWQVDFWTNSTPPAGIAAASFTATGPGGGGYPGPCGIGCGVTVSTITFVNSSGCLITIPFTVGTHVQSNITAYCGGIACGGMLTTTETITVVISTTTAGLCSPASNYVVSITIDP